MKCCGSGISLSWRTSAGCRIDPLNNTRKKARKKKRMEKILLLTDSASDLTPEDEAGLESGYSICR